MSRTIKTLHFKAQPVDDTHVNDAQLAAFLPASGLLQHSYPAGDKASFCAPGNYAPDNSVFGNSLPDYTPANNIFNSRLQSLKALFNQWRSIRPLSDKGETYASIS